MTADSNAGRAPRPNAGPLLTHVELTWLEGRIEHWIRFGHDAGETILDRRRRVLSFAPNSVFAFVRWASNDFGTIVVNSLPTVTPISRPIAPPLGRCVLSA